MSFESFKESACRQIIEHFGDAQQVDKTIEEMAELTKTLLKSRLGKDNRTEIIEELADVLIMAKQIQLIYNITDQEIQQEQLYKLGRTLARYMG